MLLCMQYAVIDRYLLFFILSVSAINCVGRSMISFLQQKGTVTQLIVDHKPYLILGRKLHNSSSSSLAYIEPIIAKFAAQHLNTVLTPVCWDLIEPREGKFNFRLVDRAIHSARRNNLRLAF